LVALQPSTGKVLAVANSSAASEDIAIAGQYPAGSTFKIVTYTAAFTNQPSLTASSPIDCPATVNVNGRQFQNENRFSHGTIAISAAFAYSCNTSAINTAMGLPAAALHQAATSLGVGAKWDLGGVDVFSGSIPASADGTERAAEAIGQGKVLVSPLAMASIAGAAASGKPVAPSLLASRPGAPGAALPAAVTAQLNTLMRATVSQPGATAYSLNDLPGNVEGKTGTAEFGTDNPPKSHSWFAGTRGDLAFAVFIYGGESSSTAAVPIARSFLTSVP
jgi:cell division protein FtsI/penicillin-binding protein 2